MMPFYSLTLIFAALSLAKAVPCAAQQQPTGESGGVDIEKAFLDDPKARPLAVCYWGGMMDALSILKQDSNQAEWEQKFYWKLFAAGSTPIIAGNIKKECDEIFEKEFKEKDKYNIMLVMGQFFYYYANNLHHESYASCAKHADSELPSWKLTVEMCARNKALETQLLEKSKLK